MVSKRKKEKVKIEIKHVLPIPINKRKKKNVIVRVAFLAMLLTICFCMTSFSLNSNNYGGIDDISFAASFRNENSNSKNKKIHHAVAGLSCSKYGGPPDLEASEMVYWKDIPSDSVFVSPLGNSNNDNDDEDVKYLTFEPDEGGWNNIRMAMETAVTLALAMGRKLVLPPELSMYLLNKKHDDQKQHFGFKDFFHFDSIKQEHSSMDVVSFEQFLQQEAMAGKLTNQLSGEVLFPPNNTTNWDRMFHNYPEGGARKALYSYLRSVSEPIEWHFDTCVVGIPSSSNVSGVEEIRQTFQAAREMKLSNNHREFYIGNPTPVDASPKQRLKEIIAQRKEMCVYDESLQKKKVIHLRGENDSVRMLVHFYAFLFFQDWKHDLWTKRFVRDHLRYTDEIQCQAAKVVSELRKLSQQNGNPTGKFHTMHIRRGDFQFKDTRIGADEIYNNAKDFLLSNNPTNNPNTKITLFIATDEMDRKFFKVFEDHFHVYFLSSFKNILTVNSNYFGMIDQLVASRGDVFVGTYYSTFTGYINRLRGYHSTHSNEQQQSRTDGIIESYYYILKKHHFAHKQYHPVFAPFWAREFPVAWRDIDHDVQN